MDYWRNTNTIELRIPIEHRAADNCERIVSGTLTFAFIDVPNCLNSFVEPVVETNAANRSNGTMNNFNYSYISLGTVGTVLAK